jgi:hypothetical protein
MKLRILFLAMLVLALPALAGSAIGAAGQPNLGTRFSTGTNRGQFVVARAHGIVSDVSALFVKVTSHPRFKIAGSYIDDCDKNGTGGTVGGKFRGKTPVVKQLDHKFVVAGKCQVSTTAQAGGDGRISVGLYVRHSPGPTP